MPETDRGQSELLGYLLVFVVVVLAISLVGTVGFAGLTDAQDFQRTTNVEHGFTALANNVDDVARGEAPSRETEIGLADASLSVDNTTTITVTVDNGTTENATAEIHSIVYDSGSGTTITYSSGALVRQDGEHAVMFRQPNFVLTNETVILPIVVTSPTGDGTVGGTTGVAVETRHAGTDLLVEDDVENVTIEVTSPHADAWYRYLDARAAAGCDAPDGDTVTCDVQPEHLYLAIKHVDVRFQ